MRMAKRTLVRGLSTLTFSTVGGAAFAASRPNGAPRVSPPHDGRPIFFDGYDNSAYVLGKTSASARQEWTYIDGTSFLGVRYQQWKFLFTAKDTWLGPDLPPGPGKSGRETH
jgi:hypothetical protein